MKVIGAGIDEETQRQVTEYCKTNRCRPSDLVKEGIAAILGSTQATQATKPQTAQPQAHYGQRAAPDVPSVPGFIDYPVCPISGLKFVMGRLATPEEERRLFAQ